MTKWQPIETAPEDGTEVVNIEVFTQLKHCALIFGFPGPDRAEFQTTVGGPRYGQIEVIATAKTATCRNSG